MPVTALEEIPAALVVTEVPHGTSTDSDTGAGSEDEVDNPSGDVQAIPGPFQAPPQQQRNPFGLRAPQPFGLRRTTSPPPQMQPDPLGHQSNPTMME